MFALLSPYLQGFGMYKLKAQTSLKIKQVSLACGETKFAWTSG